MFVPHKWMKIWCFSNSKLTGGSDNHAGPVLYNGKSNHLWINWEIKQYKMLESFATMSVLCWLTNEHLVRKLHRSVYVIFSWLKFSQNKNVHQYIWIYIKRVVFHHLILLCKIFTVVITKYFLDNRKFTTSHYIIGDSEWFVTCFVWPLPHPVYYNVFRVWGAHIYGLVQDCGISIANALEILLFCTKRSYEFWNFSDIYHNFSQRLWLEIIYQRRYFNLVPIR